MARGVNEKGEESHYVYNGFGYLVANELVIEKNAYGYTNNSGAAPGERVGGVVVCDRHPNSTGQGHINPVGKGHTTGGTAGGSPANIPGNMITVHKEYVIDYTSYLKSALMEYEHEDGVLTYRHVYGLGKSHVVIYGVQGGGGLVQTFGAGVGDGAATVRYVLGDGGGWEFDSKTEFPLGDIMETHGYGGGSVSMSLSSGTDIVKLYYHTDRLGTVGYLTDNVSGQVRGYAEYDSWGQPDLSKLVLQVGARELRGLTLQYTVHPFDQVLGAYFAQARMYDAEVRRFIAGPRCGLVWFGAVISSLHPVLLSTGGFTFRGRGFSSTFCQEFERFCTEFSIAKQILWYVVPVSTTLSGNAPYSVEILF